MADVRVRLPLGALAIGVWESLAIPPAPEAGDRWFKSNCADFNCGGATAGSCARLLNAYPAGSIPASAALTEGQANGRWQLSRKQPSDELCEFDSHSFRYLCPWPSGRGASLPSWRGGFNSRRALLNRNEYSGVVAVGSDA